MKTTTTAELDLGLVSCTVRFTDGVLSGREVCVLLEPSIAKVGHQVMPTRLAPGYEIVAVHNEPPVRR